MEFSRFAMKAGTFSRARLETLAACPSEYTICNINQELYNLCRQFPWSRDLVGQFSGWKPFRPTAWRCWPCGTASRWPRRHLRRLCRRH